MKQIKLSYCVLAYAILSYLNSFVANNISLSEGVTSKLFDIGHYLFPELSTFYPDMLFFILLIYFFFRWRHDHDLLKTFFLICSSLFFLRLLTFPATQFPPAFNETDCFKPSADGPWIFFTFYSNSTCVDYMFSAHTFHLTIISLLTLYNSGNYFEKILIPSASMINLMIIIAARMHYTADIIIGFVLSILIYCIYELYMRNRFLQKMIESVKEENS